jgi:exodeoxyribonuclease VII large subunit
MPEISGNRTIFTLLEVLTGIKTVLTEHLSETFWIKAEMTRLHFYPQSGHCYPELVEKRSGKIIAQIKANLWKDDYLRIDQKFRQVLKEPLREGISILMQAKISFDPVYGLALRILDIDPSYSLGELEREKRETIEKLRKEGIFDANKRMKFPLLPQRIAIISVETSKGYADFIKVIDQNPWGYRFFHMLFPALLQGERAVETILGQLSRIRSVVQHFDVVTLIRGGGGEVGLSCYNDYGLTRAIALFPLPVLTGIGHATNETVTEMIAHRNAITPTELADFLIQQFHNCAVPLNDSQKKITDQTRRLILADRQKLMHITKYFRSVAMHMISRNRISLEIQSEGIRKQPIQLIHNSTTALTNIIKSVSILSPANVLKRGYSITYLNGKSIRAIGNLATGDQVETIISDGTFSSTVQKISKQKPYE